MSQSAADSSRDAGSETVEGTDVSSTASGSEPTRLDLDGSITRLSEPPTKNLEPGRDKVRAAIALGLLGLLSGIVIMGFVLVFNPPGGLDESDPGLEARTLFIQSLLSVVSGLFGAASGFYFGASKSER